MALGEAFINVRADLKPFAKDLEKGLKTILRAAEKKIAGDSSFGREAGKTFGKNLGDESEKGISDGTDRGAKKGTKKAATTFEKFFASLADFFDDGLSAIPAKVKAAILLGLIAAGLLVLPLLGGVISAAVTAGITAGVLAGGIFVAARFKVVQDQFKAVGRTIIDVLQELAIVFIEPLQKAGQTIIDTIFGGVGEAIGRIFRQASHDIEPLTAALLGFVQQLLPGIEAAVRAARPLFEALRTSLPQLGRDIAFFLFVIADSGPEAALALRDILGFIGSTIRTLGFLISALAQTYFWLRVITDLMTGQTGSAILLLGQREQDAALASGQLDGKLGNVNTQLGITASEARAAELSITKLLHTILGTLDGAVAFEQAMDDLNKSIREGNHSFNERDEKGRQNIRLVEQAIQGIAQQRDSQIALSEQTGRSIESINADYESQLRQIERTVGKLGSQEQKLKDVFTAAHNLPKEVEIQVATPGGEQALELAKALARALRGIASAGAAAVRAAHGGAGLKTANQFAAGAILNQPTVGLIAEAGYAEAVIPDPAVMPQRAMQLSNQFGLTSMIADALGAGRTVVNVFIGQQRLEEIADYRISYNNQMQGMYLAQGPRGV